MKKKIAMLALIGAMIVCGACGEGKQESAQSQLSKPTEVISTQAQDVEETLKPTEQATATLAPKPTEVATKEAINETAVPTEQVIDEEQAKATEINRQEVLGAHSEKSTAKREPTTDIATAIIEKVTIKPTVKPTEKATSKPTPKPTVKPTAKPTAKATAKPTVKPTAVPTKQPIPKITINSENVPFSWYWDEVKDEYVELFEDRIIYYINKYRAEEGMDPAKKLPKISEYAEFRAWQSENGVCGDTDPKHTCEPGVCGRQGHDLNSIGVAAKLLKYGRFLDEEAKLAGVEPFWRPYGTEAYMATSLFNGFSIDEMAKHKVDVFRGSEGHWSYLRDDYYRYIGVGISETGHELMICVAAENDNGVNYHEIHNPDRLSNTCSYSGGCKCPD